MTTMPADSPPPTKSMPSRVHYTLDFASPRLATRPYLPRVFDSIGVIYFLTCALFHSGYTFGVLIDFTLSKNFRPGTFFIIYLRFQYVIDFKNSTLTVTFQNMRIQNIRLFGSKLGHQMIEHRSFFQSMTLLPYKLLQIKSHILKCDCRMFEQMLELGSSDQTSIKGSFIKADRTILTLIPAVMVSL